MQASELRSEIEVKRGMDIIRGVLLAIEDDPLLDGRNELDSASAEYFGIPDCSEQELAYHVALLIDAGFVKGTKLPNAMPVVRQLTWEGHELLDNIRDKTIWEATKRHVAGMSSVAVGIIADVAKAEIKKRLGLS